MSVVEVMMYGFAALGVVSALVLGVTNRSSKTTFYGAAGFMFLGVLGHFVADAGEGARLQHQAAIQKCVDSGNAWIEGDCYERG